MTAKLVGFSWSDCFCICPRTLLSAGCWTVTPFGNIRLVRLISHPYDNHIHWNMSFPWLSGAPSGYSPINYWRGSWMGEWIHCTFSIIMWGDKNVGICINVVINLFELFTIGVPLHQVSHNKHGWSVTHGEVLFVIISPLDLQMTLCYHWPICNAVKWHYGLGNSFQKYS